LINHLVASDRCLRALANAAQSRSASRRRGSSILLPFDAVILRLFTHQDHGPVRQLSADHVKGPKIDQRLMLGLGRMEMWRRMIIPKHLDDDPSFGCIRCIG
jgi:hypothetical protein